MPSSPLRLALALVLLLPFRSVAQPSRPIPYPVFPTPQFREAVGRGTRTLTGQPGAGYWTNAAEYDLQARIIPEAARLEGEGRLRYLNHSPDTLRQLVLHLRQNLYREGVVRNRPVEVTGGMQLGAVTLDGVPVAERTRETHSGYRIEGQMLFLDLPVGLPPGGRAELEMRWAFRVPRAGGYRMGQDGEVFYLGYWYPQFAVYDDLKGWDTDPYLGNGEFYMDWADYDVRIDAPEGWLVTATGTLQNPESVLSPTVRDRLAEAARSDSVVHVVRPEERQAGISTARGEAGRLVWHFRAERVRDFAFGASARYVWDATSASVGDRDGDGRGDASLIQAFYRPEQPAWERSAEYGRFAVEFLSERIFPYPYPHMTTVEGIIGGGMEYPMLTLIGGARTPSSLFGVTLHEIGHMWFPMIVGQDEKAFAWMDEGLTSFNSNEGRERFYGNRDAWNPRWQSYYLLAGTGREVEAMRHSDQYPLRGSARVTAAYSKPAVTLHALRGLVGQERFMEAYREYARRWAFRHPQPFDLFNTFEEVLDRELDWFWTSLLYETWVLDHSVAAVSPQQERTVVTIRDEGLTPMPVLLRVTYRDGRVEDRTLPVDAWLRGEREVEAAFGPGSVVRVEIDPEQFLPDVLRENNVWTPAEAPAAPDSSN